MAIDSSSPLGYGMFATYCTCVLPDALGNMVAVTTIQPTLGFGTNPTTGATLPAAQAGRPLLAAALLRRFSTARGTLPDTYIPTVVGNYGVSLDDYIFADMTQEDAGLLSAAIDAQARQDERVVQSATAATLAGDMLLVAINVTDGSGPFKLTLAINVLTQDTTVLQSP